MSTVSTSTFRYVVCLYARRLVVLSIWLNVTSKNFKLRVFKDKVFIFHCRLFYKANIVVNSFGFNKKFDSTIKEKINLKCLGWPERPGESHKRHLLGTFKFLMALWKSCFTLADVGLSWCISSRFVPKWKSTPGLRVSGILELDLTRELIFFFPFYPKNWRTLQPGLA